MLTNRYLTLNLLKDVPLEEYNKYKETLQIDIDLINRNTKIEELNSFKLITMKQASEIKKQYNKHEDLVITERDVIGEIIKNESFKIKINEIIKKYEKQEYFTTGKEKESISFNSANLFFALHNTYLEVIGNKQTDGTWNLDITLDDEYDFTDLQEIEEYVDNDEYLKSFAGAIGNNLAMIANSCNVVNTYHITIKFTINSKEIEL